jgi:uncharacterized membrane protein YagU involved in acid resistance
VTHTINPPSIVQAVSTATLRHAVLGSVAGLVAGLLYAGLLSSQQISPMMSSTDVPGDSAFHLFLSALVGLVFGVIRGHQITTPGAGLVWGIVIGAAWWIVGPLTLFPLIHGERPDWSITLAKSAFPLLVGLAVMYGALMGLLFWFLAGLTRDSFGLKWLRQASLYSGQAAISGGLAGLLGGWVFGQWMEQAQFFPLVAGLVNSTDASTGRGLHFGISLLIGISYGILFQRETRTPGTSIAWGMIYGLIWWILGPLTVMPWLLGQGVQWGLGSAQAVFPSLIGHLLYGVILGIAQAFLSQVWRTLFVDSDPLRREPEGPGTRGLRGILLGSAASLAGGLGFTVIMITTNALPQVAGLMGMSGAIQGFVIHMGISTLIGAAYGLLFHHESRSSVAALGWGIVYGMVWWVLGPLTLMPALLGLPLQWSSEAVSASFPSLIGHLLYGVLLALAYHRLQQRYRANQRDGSVAAAHHESRIAPALWSLVVLCLIVILLLQG